MRITRSIGWTKILPSPTSPVRAEERMALMHGSTNGSEHTISIFTFSWNSMTTVVPRYWLTISCSPPWPLTRLSVIPVTPAWNSAALTSGRRSGLTMVVMSFMMENLAPVTRAVNGIVHQMHELYVILPFHSHSILYAVTETMQVKRSGWTTHPVGLAALGWGADRSADRRRGHLLRGRRGRHFRHGTRLHPGRHREGGLHAHRASRRTARRALLRGGRGRGAVPAAPRRLLDRLRPGLWLGQHHLRRLRQRATHGRHHRICETRRRAQPQRAARRGNQQLVAFRRLGHRDHDQPHCVAVFLPCREERALRHRRPWIFQLSRQFHSILRRYGLGVHRRWGLRHPGRPGRVPHAGRELRVRRRGRREPEWRGKICHRLEAERRRVRPGCHVPLNSVPGGGSLLSWATLHALAPRGALTGSLVVPARRGGSQRDERGLASVSPRGHRRGGDALRGCRFPMPRRSRRAGRARFRLSTAGAGAPRRRALPSGSGE